MTSLPLKFAVIGISTLASNAQEPIEKKMQKLWGQFFAQNIFENIPHKLNNNIVVLYYDYESNYTGQYTYLIGAQVEPGTKAPADMTYKDVPATNYKVFTTNRGPIGNIILEAWTQIWRLEDSGKLKRLYQVDYEIHDERARNPENAQIDIYIGTPK